MIVCKWCRTEIVKVEKAPYESEMRWMPDFQHKSGMYTCPTHPETAASPADPRWENVTSYIRPGRVFPELLQFTMVVTRAGQIYQLHQMVSKETLEEATFNLYGEVLDKMVEEMDSELDKDWDWI